MNIHQLQYGIPFYFSQRPCSPRSAFLSNSNDISDFSFLIFLFLKLSHDRKTKLALPFGSWYNPSSQVPSVDQKWDLFWSTSYPRNCGRCQFLICLIKTTFNQLPYVYSVIFLKNNKIATYFTSHNIYIYIILWIYCILLNTIYIYI